MNQYGIPESEQEPQRFYTIPIPKDDYRILTIGDLHIPTHDEHTLAHAFDYGLKKKVDCILLGGDMLDWYSLSSFDKLASGHSLQDELDCGMAFLRALRKHFPDQKLIWLDGNHEFRVEKHKMKNVAIASLDSMRVKNMIALSDFDVEYYDNFATLQIGKLNVMHGHKLAGAGKMAARNKLMNAMDNVLFFHHHTVQDFFVKTLRGDVIGSWAVGCCCQLRPDYSIHNNWMNGFAIIKVDQDGNFTVDNKKIINGEVR